MKSASKACLLGVALGLLAIPSAANAVQLFTSLFSSTTGGLVADFTFADSGSYRISLAGANGGGQFRGNGAQLIADFNVAAGTRFEMLIGANGGRQNGFNAHGGGGGTFIVVDANPFFIAGGGGGAGAGGNGDAVDGQSGTAGTAGGGLDAPDTRTGGGSGGVNGNGGNGARGGGGFGGGGLYTAFGTTANFSQARNSSVNGIATRTTGGLTSGDGGGGGGGFSGGGGGHTGGTNRNFGGGGGGSFIDAGGTLIFDKAFAVARPASGDGGISIWRITEMPIEPPLPGVPEPATWAMLIIGFGAIGVATRRRRTLVTR